MTNEEMFAKLENVTEDKTVELLKEFAEDVNDGNEELDESELEDVAGGTFAATSVAAIYRRYNRLSRKEKEKWKKKLKELIDAVIKRGKVLMPF